MWAGCPQFAFSLWFFNLPTYVSQFDRLRSGRAQSLRNNFLTPTRFH
jgi:hypothetical protein